MKIKDYVCKCGCSDFTLIPQKPATTGIYCTKCGKWFKWANKDEKNLRMKQEPVIDKIRAEIEHDALMDVNGSKYIFVNRVNQILDKYKAESEER